MKTRIAVTCLVSLSLFAGRLSAEELTSLPQRLSYAIGTQMAQSLTQLPVEFDRDAFNMALDDAFAQKTPRLTPEQMQAVFKDLQTKQRQQAKDAGKKNVEKGKAFLAENKKKEGVVTTDSGLQYKVVKEGEGKKPTATDRVEVHYRGTTIDGKEFDSSFKRGKPAVFGVGGVIKGWTEALQLMTVGSTYKLFIPSALAYGERGAGGDIGPNEVLIFDVELLDIK